MNKGKLLSGVFGVLLLYFVAAGGLTSTGSDPDRIVEIMTSLFTRGNPFDVLLAVVAVLCLVCAAAPSPDHAPDRAHLLRGIAFGCAIVAVGCAVAISCYATEGRPSTVGALAIMMLGQSFVGLIASLSLLSRRESRRLAVAPMILNGSVAGLTAFVFLAPLL